MKVILDCNIWISFLFGKRLSGVAHIFRNPNIQIYVSEELLAELRSVVSRPKISKYISQDAIDAMWDLINERCLMIKEYAPTNVTVRDTKDVYLLSMADAIPADILVTGDQDLLVLKQHNNTAILAYQQFALLL